MPRIAVTGSVATDSIMVFPGRFGEHILPDKTHLINVSFLVDRMERRRGGTAANIAYTLALLGEHPLLCAAVGDDFGEFGQALRSVGVDTSVVLACDDVPTATCFITTDLDNNQITAFYPGAMARAAELDLRSTAPDAEFVVVSPDAPEAMAAHIAQARELQARLVFSPAQQLPSLSDLTLHAGLDAAWLVVANDYEMNLIESRTGRSAQSLGADTRLVAITHGAEGSELYFGQEHVTIPAAAPATVTDPTGAGDAYLAGLLVGLAHGRPLAVAGRTGALAATYVVEQQGTQSHRFTVAEFDGRYAQAFGAPAH